MVELHCKWLVGVMFLRASNFNWDNADQILSLSSHLEKVYNVSLLFAPRSANYVAYWVAYNIKNASLSSSLEVYTPIKLSILLAKDFETFDIG